MENNIKTEIDLNNPKYYLNRELSMIEFNRRVLLEAADTSNPLLERLKFAIIFSSNLDEFFMIRVAGLKNQICEGVVDLSYNGMTPIQQLKEIKSRLIPLYEQQEQILIKDILPLLRQNGVCIPFFYELDEKSKLRLKKYFQDNILPALTPVSLSPANPFPRLISRSLNVAFVLKDKLKHRSEKKFAFVKIPSILQRLIPLTWLEGEQYILLEHLVKEFAELIFPGMTILTTNTFRVTRDADIEIAEDEAEDLIDEIAGQLKKRWWGRAAVRLEHSSNMPKYLSRFLMNSLELEPDDIYIVNRPLSLSDFMSLYNTDRFDLKDKPFAAKKFAPFNASHDDIFTILKKSDFLVHHPFDDFDSSVVKFIEDSAKDPDVVAIKLTLYRTNRTSDIVKALKRAAEKGKYITALVELKARFDEEKNIEWALDLERSGAHVVYGVPGLKTHCKICLVVRKEGDKLKTYMHVATGNYNQITAKLYTDVGFFTSDHDFTNDAVNLFNYMTAYSHNEDWKKLILAPNYLYNKTIELIQREIDQHTPENPGLIIVKTNSLAHKDLIPQLYRASQAGVEIRLLVRGVCCLKPGIEGISDNIEVRSVVGRFLEHSRIFYYKNAGNPEVYLSSADWMSRNMHTRVEIMFPIEEEKLKNWLIEWLDLYWSDNLKSWSLNSEGKYIKRVPADDEKPFSAQEYFLDQIRRK